MSMRGFFSFDALNGDYPLLGAAVSNGIPVAVSGVSDAQKYFIASLFAGRIVYLTADALTAQRAAEAIRALSGKRVALLAPKDEVLTYRKAGSKDALYKRLTALAEWQAGADVLVADIEAAAQLVPARLPVFHLETGKEREMQTLIGELTAAGYVREYSPESRGAFAVRGDVLDIWPVNAEHPVRIDFFGDEVESIKPYDEVTGERYEKCSAIDIAAATDVVFAAGERERVLAALRAECRRAESSAAFSRLQTIAEDIEAGNVTDFILPLLENSRDLFSVLPRDTLLVLDECKLMRDKLEGLYKEHFERFGELRQGGEVMSFSSGQLAPAGRMENFSDFRTVALQTFAGNTYFFQPLRMLGFTSTPARRYLGSLPDLITDLKAWKRTGYRVMLWCGTPERAQKMRETLSEEYLPVRALQNCRSLRTSPCWKSRSKRALFCTKISWPSSALRTSFRKRPAQGASGASGAISSLLRRSAITPCMRRTAWARSRAWSASRRRTAPRNMSRSSTRGAMFCMSPSSRWTCCPSTWGETIRRSPKSAAASSRASRRASGPR